MGIGRRATLAVAAAASALAIVAGVMLPSCARRVAEKPSPQQGHIPLVRVRLLAAQDKATLRVSAIPTVKTESEMTALRLNMAFDTDAAIVLTNSGWEISGVAVPGRGELTIWPSEDASVAINGKRYRGKFRLVPNTSSSPTALPK